MKVCVGETNKTIDNNEKTESVPELQSKLNILKLKLAKLEKNTKSSEYIKTWIQSYSILYQKLELIRG